MNFGVLSSLVTLTCTSLVLGADTVQAALSCMVADLWINTRRVSIEVLLICLRNLAGMDRMSFCESASFSLSNKSLSLPGRVK